MPDYASTRNILSVRRPIFSFFVIMRELVDTNGLVKV